MSVNEDSVWREMVGTSQQLHSGFVKANEPGEVKATERCKSWCIVRDILAHPFVMVRVDQSHLTRRANSPSELVHYVGSLVEGCLKLAAVLACCPLDPSSDFGRIGEVTSKRKGIGLEVRCHINKLLHVRLVVQGDLKVRNHHRRVHVSIVH